jgi:hypothetical protein
VLPLRGRVRHRDTGKHEILPEFFEPPFERGVEDLRLGDAALFGDPANAVGKLSGRTVDFAATLVEPASSGDRLSGT